MTLNILFLTLTIQKRKISALEAKEAENARKVLDDNKARQASLYRYL